MQPAIFDMVFPRPTLAERMTAIADAGFSAFQLDFAAAGLDSMPLSIPERTIADLRDKGIAIKSLKEGEDLTGTTGELVAGIMVMIAQWERRMNAERVAEARAARAARAKDGEQVAGRPRTALTAAKIAEVLKYRAKGHSAGDIAKLTGMSRASVYRALETKRTDLALTVE